MKKLSLLLLLLVQIVAYGQSFRFYPGVGIRDARDSSKGFIVFNFSGMTADEIKAAVVAKIPSIYPSSGRVQSGENNSIILNANSETAIFHLGPDDNIYDARHGSHDIGGNFTMKIDFKDGKIRYDAPSIQRLYQMLLSQRGSYPTYGNMLDPIDVWINTDSKRAETSRYFNKLVGALNKAVEEAASKSADW